MARQIIRTLYQLLIIQRIVNIEILGRENRRPTLPYVFNQNRVYQIRLDFQQLVG